MSQLTEFTRKEILTILNGLPSDSGIQLTYCGLKNMDFRGLNLSKGNFLGSDMSSTKFDSAVLVSANLEDVDLSGSSMNKTDLKKVSL